tara:strand:+ start:48 stop:215 length:168 start_codon:yes stop_codon:yes gene_type:complete
MKVEITLVVDVDETDEVICPDGRPLEQNCILNAVDNDFFLSPVEVLSVKQFTETK